MSRSTRILGKVLRNLKKHGIPEGDHQDEEIYSELVDAQDNILSDTFPDRNVTITLEEDEEFYPLTTETVTDPALTTYKNNISAVKVVKQPTGFVYPFTIISNIDFTKLIDGVVTSWYSLLNHCIGINTTSYIQTGAAMEGAKDGANLVFTIPEPIVENSEEIYFNGVLQVRGTDYSILNQTITFLHGIAPVSEDTLVCNYIKFTSLGNAIVNTNQPLIGTIIGKRLRLYPIPDSEFDGVEIELYVYQKSSAGTIDEDDEPELDEEWDKSLVYYATAELLTDTGLSNFYMDKFRQEKERLRPTVHHKRGTISRSSVFEGMK